jgi:hypothetical protein
MGFFSRQSLVLVALVTLTVASAQQPTPIPLRFNELYSKVSSSGVELSPKLQAANGKRVEMVGYMAPPLKSEIDFFVLSSKQLAVCPFCASAAEWPSDIVLVLMRNGQSAAFSSAPLRVRGRLELGVKEDPETGFVSLVRIYADEVETLKR